MLFFQLYAHTLLPEKYFIITSFNRFSMKFLFTLFMLCCAFAINAQPTVSIVVDPVTKTLKRQQDRIKTGNGFISIQFHKPKVKVALPFSKINMSKFQNSITLLKFNSAMELEKENDLGLLGFKFYFGNPIIKELNGKTYLIYTDIADDEDGMVKKAAEINTNTLELGSPKLLFQLPLKMKIGVLNLWNIDQSSNLHIQSSPDKSKILFQYETGTNSSFSTCITDSNLNVLWNKDNKIETAGGDLSIISACVDNAGTAYVGYKIETGKSLSSPTVTGHIFICDQEQNIKTISIPAGDGVYQVLLLPSRTENFIYVAGLCAGTTEYMSGVFSARIDIATKKFNEFKITNFEENFINQFSSGKLAFTKNRKYGLYPSYMQMYQLADGSFGMIGTIRRSEEVPLAGRSTTASYSYTYYVSGGIMNAYFSKDKVVFSCIPKYMSEAYMDRSTNGEALPDQYSEDWGYSSRTILRDMFAYPVKNDLLVFYHDNEKNINQELTEKIVDTRGGMDELVLAVASISAEGIVKRKVLFDGRKDNFLGLPALMQRETNASLLIPISSTSGRKDRDNFCWGHIAIK
jgi:hypothetical protein